MQESEAICVPFCVPHPNPMLSLFETGIWAFSFAKGKLYGEGVEGGRVGSRDGLRETVHVPLSGSTNL